MGRIDTIIFELTRKALSKHAGNIALAAQDLGRSTRWLRGYTKRNKGVFVKAMVGRNENLNIQKQTIKEVYRVLAINEGHRDRSARDLGRSVKWLYRTVIANPKPTREPIEYSTNVILQRQLDMLEETVTYRNASYAEREEIKARAIEKLSW